MLAPKNQKVGLQARTLPLAAVLIIMSLSSLDQTIVSTALPTIVGQLKGIGRYAWVATAYMMMFAIALPVYGRLGDIFSHRSILTTGVVIFLGGSVLSGLSGTIGAIPVLGDGMQQLVIFRGIQGLGAAALTIGSFAIVGQLFTPAERGRYSGLFGGISAVCNTIGPLVGGFFTDYGTVRLGHTVVSGWRWIFYFTVPIGLVALAILLACAPPRAVRGSPRQIDWLGGTLLASAVGPLIFALSAGGHVYAWASAPVLALLAVAIATGLALVQVERRRAHAILAIPLLTDPVIARACLAMFLSNVSFVGLLIFLPLFAQTVQGVRATGSGLALLPLMLGLVIGSTFGGFIASRTHRYKPVMMAFGPLLPLGMAWLSMQDGPIGTSTLALLMLLMGCGLGPAQSLLTIAVQNAARPSQIGSATSLIQFARYLGTAVGVTVLGAVLAAALAGQLSARTPDVTRLAHGSLGRIQQWATDPSALRIAASEGHYDPDRLKTEIRGAFAAALSRLFAVGSVFALAGFVATTLIPDRRLRDHHDDEAPIIE